MILLQSLFPSLLMFCYLRIAIISAITPSCICFSSRTHLAYYLAEHFCEGNGISYDPNWQGRFGRLLPPTGICIRIWYISRRGVFVIIPFMFTGCVVWFHCFCCLVCHHALCFLSIIFTKSCHCDDSTFLLFPACSRVSFVVFSTVFKNCAAFIILVSSKRIVCCKRSASSSFLTWKKSVFKAIKRASFKYWRWRVYRASHWSYPVLYFLPNKLFTLQRYPQEFHHTFIGCKLYDYRL